MITIDMNAIGRIDKRGAHQHQCPECYRSMACEHTCTIEPDQCGEGVDRGAITRCDECERREGGR